MSDVLNVKVREELGTNRVKHLRRAGKIPAVLYGHGEANLNLTVPATELEMAIRHGSQVVQLQGDISENALIRDVQWCAFGIDVLHVDLTRVSRGERVEITVSLEVRGEAPGTKAGGVLAHVTHELAISCPAMSVPESIEVNINALELNESLTVADLELPEGVQAMTPAETVVVQVNEAAPEVEEEAAASLPGEPEVIGRKSDEEGDEG